jgi:hypothetical protein
LEQDVADKAVTFGAEDGVYVFDRNGDKRRYDHGEALLL